VLRENDDVLGAFPHRVKLAALEVDNSSTVESVRQAKRMVTV
jgi:hypothetical protein